ncbi:MAG: hypothetical protein HC883_00745 [Bdellovibrionaceae bacterium]|nr:hypothetical protein [Pseudobdellovibrionaceae bacterium]
MQNTVRLLLLAYFAIALSACTRPSSNNGSNVRIRMPSQEQLQQFSKAWGVTNPTAFTDINCFIVFFQGPESYHQDNTCTDSDGKTVSKPGEWYGGFFPGEPASISVPSGRNRTISIIGVKATSAAACTLARSSLLNSNSFSNPYIIGKETQDLAPGDATMTITANWDTAIQIDECSGPDFSGPAATPNYPSATSLVWITEPDGGIAGAAFSQQPKLKVVDSSGNTVTSGPDATFFTYRPVRISTGPSTPTASIHVNRGALSFTRVPFTISTTLALGRTIQ